MLDTTPVVHAQYVRVFGTKRATPYRYSMFNFEVFGIIKYIWSPASAFSDIHSERQVLSPTTTTTYSVKIPDKCNAQVDVDFTVFVDNIAVSLGNNKTICASDTLIVNATVTGAIGDVTYLWTPFFNDSTSYKHLPPYSDSTFKVKVIAQGELECSIDSSEITISVEKQREFNVQLTYTKCLSSDGFLTVSSTSSVEEINLYKWFKNNALQTNTSPTYTFTPTIGDSIYLEAVSNSICLDVTTAISDTLTIDAFSPLPIAKAGNDLTIEFPEDIELNGSNSVNGTNFKWEKHINGNQETISTAITHFILPSVGVNTYILSVSNENCPTAYDTVIITFNNPEIEIPNVFSPNGDNSHDTWNIKNSELFGSIVVKVFNRWGSLVYESERGNYNTLTAWDGTYKGEALPVGTYYFIVDLNIDRAPYKGPVTILR